MTPCDWLDMIGNFMWNDLHLLEVPVLGDILLAIVEFFWDLFGCL